ncbi:BAG domain-containing protein Samui-like [Phlebotomus argentipes]|uniref:BAG domain-containing protein Samui-like n=1 Tax=Phlebotomus argentipes TaxID=94469 RepID=UPI00289328E8|nr:BAG domain-containing protein Samui-like [Phlebotomus argentipes]
MSHPVTTDTVNGSVNATPEQSNHQPNVRHIPIFVEGRDEPVINKNFDTTPSQSASGSDKGSPNASFGEPGSLFSRVKSFPVRSSFDSELFQKAGARTASPGRTVPIKVHQQAPQQTSSAQQAPAKAPEVPESKPQSNAKPDSRAEAAKQLPRDDLIGKIERIQKDVLALMDQVEKYTGTSRRDKQYLYLDEMLTQNLLKLDTIDTDGQEKIKQARRNAIACINQCIAVLEQKTDAAAKNGDASAASRESAKAPKEAESEASQRK